MRAKLDDLYDIYPGKWVLFNKSEWKNGDIDTCEVRGIYDTEEEGLVCTKKLINEEGSASLFKMERLDNYGFMLSIGR
ncbi:MAG: hypothetical protein FWG68_09075 [Defluviitaleaceae bacterium]|nr:hypothetical protein [Defluviitaleaceae bacterium]